MYFAVPWQPTANASASSTNDLIIMQSIFPFHPLDIAALHRRLNDVHHRRHHLHRLHRRCRRRRRRSENPTVRLPKRASHLWPANGLRRSPRPAVHAGRRSRHLSHRLHAAGPRLAMHPIRKTDGRQRGEHGASHVRVARRPAHRGRLAQGRKSGRSGADDALSAQNRKGRAVHHAGDGAVQAHGALHTAEQCGQHLRDVLRGPGAGAAARSVQLAHAERVPRSVPAQATGDAPVVVAGRRRQAGRLVLRPALRRWRCG